MPLLELHHVYKGYGKGIFRTEVLNDISLQVAEGEFVAIVGYSGTGKTTLISTLAGLQKPDRGKVLMRGEPVLSPSPDRGVVFQNYSLLPWLSVLDNIDFAVKEVFPNWSFAQRIAHCEKYIAMVKLSHAAHKKPSELSGGMRQRVSLARTLATQPQVLLLDEPLSALDAITRATLQSEIISIWEKDRRTVVLITNDVEEALLLADRVIPLLPSQSSGAMLGDSFPVRIPRPRTRESVIQHADFKSLKKHIVNTLLTARKRSLEADLAAAQ